MEEALSGDRAASCRKEHVAKHYFMGGKYMGVLYLSSTNECKFRSANTNITTPWHGKWVFCQDCRGMKAFFDFDGRAAFAKNKWTFLRGVDGVDYKGRYIQVVSADRWHWNFSAQRFVLRDFIPWPDTSVFRDPCLTSVQDGVSDTNPDAFDPLSKRSKL